MSKSNKLSQPVREKVKRLRPLRRLLLALVGLVLFGAVYLVGAYFWMEYRARQAGLVDPTSPYQETMQGQGQSALTVTVLGDSTAIGTGTTARSQTFAYQVIRDSLLSRYGSVEYINRAVSGAKVKDVMDNQLGAAVQDQPGLVFISIGANDVTGLTGADQFRANLKNILDRLTGETQARIILLGVPAVYSASVLLPPYPQLLDIFTKRLNEAENALIPAYPTGRILPVDIYDTTGPVFSRQPELFAADGYHPNKRGYAVWAKEVEKVLG